MTMQLDLATRAKAIHWPEGFDPETADVFARNSLLIHASCERVWSHIVDAGKWPQWYPNAKDVSPSSMPASGGRPTSSSAETSETGRGRCGSGETPCRASCCVMLRDRLVAFLEDEFKSAGH